jgi:hypothetical protein
MRDPDSWPPSLVVADNLDVGAQPAEAAPVLAAEDERTRLRAVVTVDEAAARVLRGRLRPWARWWSWTR